MTPSIFIFVGLVAAATFAALQVYRRIWTRVRGPEVTPTGFGVFLAPLLLMTAGIFTNDPGLIAAYAILSAATGIYWLDDFKGLSARLRMGVSFVTGAAIGLCLVVGDGLSAGTLIAVCIAAGALNVVLTNIVNFYDGADLNLGTFIVLVAVFILLFVPAGQAVTWSAMACLAFIVPFGLMNRIPRTIYLGDSGSFAFASFLTLLAIMFFEQTSLAPEVAIPLALPALDTFYVFCVRVIEKHDLMTRNYLHLYQKLDQQYEGFGYLLPQLANAVLVLACGRVLQSAGWASGISVAIAMTVVTIPFYFGCRALLLSQPSGRAQ
jgi:UDP-N-acetylmuramyl pentapeptide phosphotransferase/UDP-N-acetylglucosamine-1-phosphate transferase